jgi:polyether ionophore transport system ATP-binding protein
VEAVCDRIAILRAGRLVDIGTLEEMRHLSALKVEVELDGPAPDLSGIAGVTGVEIDDHRVHCQVTGPIEPLLQALVPVGVRHLTSEQPSLEELFLAHYGADGDPSGGAA